MTWCFHDNWVVLLGLRRTLESQGHARRAEAETVLGRIRCRPTREMCPTHSVSMSARTSLDVGRGVATSSERSRFSSVLSTGCKECTKLKLYLVTHEQRWPAGQFHANVYYEVSGMFISAENKQSALEGAIKQKPVWNYAYMEAIECNEDGFERRLGGTPLTYGSGVGV